jgi:hypothetical protein
LHYQVWPGLRFGAAARKDAADSQAKEKDSSYLLQLQNFTPERGFAG